MFDLAGRTLVVRLGISRNISGHSQWDIPWVHSDIGPRDSLRRMNTVRMVDLNIRRPTIAKPDLLLSGKFGL